MKPANFPERVNARRKVAFAHLNPGSRRYAELALTLQARIVPGGRRDVRTKINRSTRGPKRK